MKIKLKAHHENQKELIYSETCKGFNLFEISASDESRLSFKWILINLGSRYLSPEKGDCILEKSISEIDYFEVDNETIIRNGKIIKQNF